MSLVLNTYENLTGRFEMRPTFFGPRVFVEVVANTWDTNTGKDVSTKTYFRKLRNREVSLIGPATASATELLDTLKKVEELSAPYSGHSRQDIWLFVQGIIKIAEQSAQEKGE
jgi:hypothetical protein